MFSSKLRVSRSSMCRQRLYKVRTALYLRQWVIRPASPPPAHARSVTRHYTRPAGTDAVDNVTPFV